ncbi:response regulator [Leeuwenhoekiella parthenopeia]|uniref:Response regulator n=1 Tax=Leeuwenhoekiella parthenopeia TaxID=2890320 RepID=A0ABS8GSX2_9FLAO|nr:response regulator [Leeuwenhoekiella parthenopeia]MCC4213072.1 response regulator [Leeuwenhoekiella parthenopeia]
MNKKFKTVCIIDDDPIFVFGATRLMKQYDFSESIVVYTNGREALDHLKPLMESKNLDTIPDLIFLDLNMPVLDGWGFLDEFTKIDPPKIMKVYIVTSSISNFDKQKAKEYAEAVKEYVIKPITPVRLKEIIKNN